jgi:hypothetical protein
MSAERARTPRAGEVAWIAALPCALALLAAIVWLGPVIGHALPGPGADALWPREAHYVAGQPEPVKHGRYLVALAGPALLAAAVLVPAGRRGRLRLQPATLRALVGMSQLALVAFLVLTVLSQHNVALRNPYPLWPIFSVGKMAFAAALAGATVLALRRAGVARLVARAARERRALRLACLVVAGGLAAAWLLAAIDSDRSIGDGGGLDWPMDDTFAVLNGRTPLLNYHPVYAQLVPYLSAGTMRVLGATALTFTLTMATLSLLALLAVYATLRRVARSSPLALALFLPLLAAGFLLVHLPDGAVLSAVRLFSMWPMRYGGAYLVAWLTARQLDGAAPRRIEPLAFVAGLVLIDDVEFGASALVATVAALLCARRGWSPRTLAALVARVAVGLLVAGLAVALLTLVRGGQLPRPGILLEYPRIFGTAGSLGVPMPTMGLHLAVYVTFAATIAVAAVRRAGWDEEPLLTGMLAWSGVFGLLAGSYFVGRSDTVKLVSLFSAWFLALALLAVAAIRQLAARGWRRPGVAQLGVLFALGLGLGSFNELPRPWSQLARLHGARQPVVYRPTVERLIARYSRPGEKVAILVQGGHRAAYEVGVTNVAPYSFIEAMLTQPQMLTLVRTVRRERAHTLFLPTELMTAQQLDVLAGAGFSPKLANREFAIWSDDGPVAPVARPR